MCGRFTLTSPVEELAGMFNVLVKTGLTPRYNIAPTQPVVCVRQPSSVASDEASPNTASSRELVEMRWGLIPHWAKDPAIGTRMINARSESVAEKPAYKDAFRKRRCLVLADGFYEWRRLKGGKQPYFIYLEDRRPFAFAGLWARWKPRAGQLEEISGGRAQALPLSADGRVESCTFLTTGPNELMEPIHDRMPVILPPECWDAWLDPENRDGRGLADLLRPYAAEKMCAHPVSTHVNKPANDDPQCIEPLPRPQIVRPQRGDGVATQPDAKPDPTQDTLF